MCYSQAEGGQRCYGHARKSYDNAVWRQNNAASFARDAQGTPDHEHRRGQLVRAMEDVLIAEEQLASTPQGRQELVSRAETLAESPRPADRARADSIRRSVQIGDERRERNAAIRAAVLRARPAA